MCFLRYATLQAANGELAEQVEELEEHKTLLKDHYQTLFDQNQEVKILGKNTRFYEFAPFLSQQNVPCLKKGTGEPRRGQEKRSHLNICPA